MPSPFPGMDPYLEYPALGPDVHHSLIALIRETLVPQVRPRYAVRVEQRVYVNDIDDPAFRILVPDLRIVGPARSTPFRSDGPRDANTITAPVIVTSLLDEEVSELRVEIIDRGDKAVVTIIELVSPANKVRGAEGPRSFTSKRREVTNSDAHWIEIDLLRRGTRTVNPSGVRESDYLVYLDRRDGDERRRLAWPFDLHEVLPTIAVPLREPDHDVALNLQSILTTAYERAGYDLEVNYDAEPNPPLNPSQKTWATHLLTAFRTK